MGTALENFTDFVKATGPIYISGPDKLVNEAVKQSYVLDRFLRGRGSDEVVQGGETINDDIMFDDASTYDHYKPNATFDWAQPQTLTELSIAWRFSIDHMSWTDQEIELNLSDGMTKEATKVQYKRLRKKIEQRMWTSMINGFEEDLWADANNQTAEMETTSGSLPYSIPAFISEDTTNYHANGWTNVMTVNPATESKWRNQVTTYDNNDPDDSDGDRDGLLDAFDTQIRKVRFKPPSFHKEHFEAYDLQTSRQFIASSRSGQTLYVRTLRDSNDTLVSKQDAAYMSPKYGGLDVMYVGQLDSAALYAGDSSTWVAEEAATVTTTGPRYYWINANYLKPVYHAARYFYKKSPFFHPNQPYTTICPVDCWWNLFCASRQRQGIVSPGA